MIRHTSVYLLLFVSMLFFSCQNSTPKSLKDEVKQTKSIVEVEKEETNTSETEQPKPNYVSDSDSIIIKPWVGMFRDHPDYYQSSYGNNYKKSERHLVDSISKLIGGTIDTTVMRYFVSFPGYYQVKFDKMPFSEGYAYVNKNLTEYTFVSNRKLIPYKISFPDVSQHDGFPTYNIRNKTRAEIAEQVPNIKWYSDEGDPDIMLVKRSASNITENRNAIAYSLIVYGKKDPLAFQSKLYVRNERGALVDSLEHVGSEIRNPRITDDGRFLAYLYGKVFPPDDYDQPYIEKYHFIIYDLISKQYVYELKDFQFRSALSQRDNFFSFVNQEGVYTFCSPHQKMFYELKNKDLYDWKWGKLSEDGVEALGFPGEIHLSWKNHFNTISFKNFKQ